MINDEESLLRSLQSYFKTNLNTYISAINTEKNDGIRIDSIPADDRHYIFGGELLDIPNFTFVNFAIDGDIEMKSNSNDVASVPNIMIEVVFDNPKTPGTYFKSIRYMRAIYNTIMNYESSVPEIDELLITRAVPMSVTVGPRSLIVSGVSLSVALC